MRQKLIWILFWGLIGTASIGQVRFTARAEASKVLAKSPFKVTFELKNAQGRSFTPPDFKGFEVLSGPSRMNMINIINGHRTLSTSYSYEIMATRPGKYTIGAARILADGQIRKTNPIGITVVKGKPSTTAGKDNSQALSTIIRLETDTGSYYVGQQIILSLKLLTSQNILDYDVGFNPDFTDAYIQEINVQLHKKREIVNGKEYASYILKRYAFYPQRAGIFKLPAAMVQIGVEDPNAPARRSFFFDPPMKRYRLVTDPIELKIKDLPEGAPPSFAGAIGHYTAKFFLNHKSLTTDDAAKLTLQLTVDGDIKVNEAPKQDFGENIEIYDPVLKSERPLNTEDRVRFQKYYEYALIPTKPGNYPIIPEFTYFNPDSESYKTIYADTVQLRVAKGLQGGHNRIVSETDLYDLRGIHYKPSLGSRVILLWGHPMYWAFMLAILLWMLWSYYQVYQKKKEASIDPTIRKKQHANQMAQKHLKAAIALRQSGDSAYFKAIQEGILGYLKDKLGMKTSQLSKNNIRQTLLENNIEPALIDDTLQIIEECDTALYAPSLLNEQRDNLIDKAARLLSNFEEHLV